MSDMKKLMIIDGSSLVHRAFYALPPLETSSGIYTNAVYGFFNMLDRVKKEHSPEYMCVAFDKKGPTLRHKKYEDYKGHRDKTPTELSQQFPIIKDILRHRNIITLELDDYEADDIAGTLAKKGEEEGLEVMLITGDKDYLQLATDNTKVYLTRRGITNMDEYDKDKILDEYGILPKQLIDLKGLMGDQSDNIPGVPGIGKVRGLKLIQDYENIDNIYKNIDNITAKAMKNNLIENEKIAYLSRDLSKIVTDIDLDISINDLKVEEENWEELSKLYSKFELNKLLEEIPEEFKTIKEEKKTFEYKTIETDEIDEILDKLSKEKKIAFKFLTEDFKPTKKRVIGLGIKGLTTTTYYLDSKDLFSDFFKFKCIFENDRIQKIGHDLKEDILILFQNGINIKNYTFDSMVGEYLIDPSQKDYSINRLSKKYLNYYGLDKEMLIGKGNKQKSFFDIEDSKEKEYIAFILNTIFDLEDPIIGKIKELSMYDLYYDIELPLIEVLSNMEYLGFKVNKEELLNLDIEYSKEIEELTEEIHKLAGMEFNINSPKQVGEALFEKMGLPVIKKTKTGYSTSVDVLEELLDINPIAEKILRYREISKLKSTYIDGLSELINKNTGRIHSSFNQTITSTGRLSSTNPNLQNIPIRTKDGRRIRKAFIADYPEYILIDADYSQIELRVLAHISEDEKMKKAFNEDLDIHRQTASEVFNMSFDDVDDQTRDSAKAVNFGIVYGISDYGLSQDLGISRKEAKDYIDGYLNNYIGVKEFMDEIIKIGKKQGYVETLMKRRRYIPELNNTNYNIRSFGERIALNTPIQGSAADIIKIAMIEVYNELNNRGLKSKLILQVHDELIIETHKDEIEEVEELLKDIMENAYQLSVPLKVDIEKGDSWYDTL